PRTGLCSRGGYKLDFGLEWGTSDPETWGTSSTLEPSAAVPRIPLRRQSMKLRFAAAALTLALTPAALFAAEGTFDRTLHVTGAATLNVSTGSGYIHITPGPAGSVHIIGHIHASNGLFSGSPEQRVRQITD